MKVTKLIGAKGHYCAGGPQEEQDDRVERYQEAHALELTCMTPKGMRLGAGEQDSS
jgi:hypothetical protein